jgi:transmembrane sensor
MKNKTAKALLFKYNNGTASEEEIAWVESWYLKFEDKVPDIHPGQIKEDEAESRMLLQVQLAQKPTLRSWKTIGIAAAVIFVIAFGMMFYVQRTAERQIKSSTSYHNDIPPGQDKALLTLSDGKKIVLFKVKDGIIAEQNGMAITKTIEGELRYQKINSSLDHRLIYNTLETPRGGQYRVVLPDGTKVWLNAASSLKFPVSFSNVERSVTLDGEAYFEVEENKGKPFIVHTPHQQVEVLGTHFNINSYKEDTEVKTTLLKGSIKVSLDRTGQSKILKPGEQALQSGGQLFVKQVDAEESIAWKNGYFQFKDEQIGSIMQKIARWYDVEINYTKGVNKNETFSGTISRFDHVSKVLEKLELTGVVHFQIEGRKVLVQK